MLLRTNREVSIQFSNYVSHNNPELVKAVAAYNQQLQKSILQAGDSLIGAAAAGVIK